MRGRTGCSMSLAEGFLWDRRVSQAPACSMLLQSCWEQPPSLFPWSCVRPGAAAGGWHRAGRVGGCGLIGTSVPQDAGRQRELLRSTLQPSDLPCKSYPELRVISSAGLGALNHIKIYTGLSGPAKLVFPGLHCVEFSPEPLRL